MAKYPKNRLKGTLLSHLQIIWKNFRAEIGQMVKFDPKLLLSGLKSPKISSLAPQMLFVHPYWMLMATDIYNRLESIIEGKFYGMQDLCLTEIGQIWPKIAEKRAEN